MKNLCTELYVSFFHNLGTDIALNLFYSSGRETDERKRGAAHGLRELSKRQEFLSQFTYNIARLYYAIIFERVPGNASHHAAIFEMFVGGGC